MCYFTLPTHAQQDIYDTYEIYRLDNISYGDGCIIEVYNNMTITFVHNVLKAALNIDERNMCFCKYLNLSFSSINQLETKYLSALLVL